jgi:hypothetical protein
MPFSRSPKQKFCCNSYLSYLTIALEIQNALTVR